MNATHTPGPWRAAEYFGDDDGAWFYSHTIYGPADEFICHTSLTAVWGGTDEHTEANARLIAAAPELLESLDELYKQVGESGWNNASPLISVRDGRAALLNKVRFALAKAEGGAA